MKQRALTKVSIYSIALILLGTSIIPCISAQTTPSTNSYTKAQTAQRTNPKNQPLSNNPIVYWNFDEGAGTVVNDLSGHGNNGIVDGATWTTGVHGSALNFVGSDCVGDIPSTYDSPISTAYTVAAWIKWNGPTGADCIIFEFKDSFGYPILCGEWR